MVLHPAHCLCCSSRFIISGSMQLLSFLFLCFLRSQPFYFNHGSCFILQQEDKEPVFDSTKTIIGMLEVCAEFAQNITFNREKIKKALPAGHLDATTLADYLVKKVSHFPRIFDLFSFSPVRRTFIFLKLLSFQHAYTSSTSSINPVGLNTYQSCKNDCMLKNNQRIGCHK